jgi:hypothetical protein
MVILFGIIAGAACAATLLRPGSQPTYQHRTLQNWLIDCPDEFGDYETYGGPGPKYLQVQAAVRAMGTNAVPALMAMFTAEDSRLKRTMIRSLPHWVPLHVREASKQHHLAETGFRLLGSQAFSAVPALTNLVAQRDPETQLRALITLSIITSNREVLLPVLTERLKDQDWQVRALAAIMLQDKRSNEARTNAVGFE